MRDILLTSSVLILAVALLRRLLGNRIDPRVQYALWLLVALRLLIPGSLFPAPVSVMGAAEAAQSAIAEALPPRETPGAAPVPAAPETLPPQTDPAISAGVPESVPQAAPSPAGTARDRLRTVWFAGMAVTAAALFLSNAAFYVRLRRGRRRLTAEELPLPCSTAVYEAEDLASPCLFGLFRPAIYLNKAALPPERLAHILVHEQTHLRHLDHLWALLRGLCLTVYWFDPLVWWAAVLSRRDCELACDAGAIARLGEARRLDYGQTLVSMVIPHTSPADLLRASTTMTAGKRTMTERVRRIAQKPRNRWLALAALALAVAAVALVTFGGAGKDAPVDNPPPVTNDIAAAPSASDGASDGAAALDSDKALALYGKAREAWDWFELGTIPTAGGGMDGYSRVDGFDSLEALRSYLRTLFSQDLTERLLTGYQRFQEKGGHLYVKEAGRGSSLYAGEETVTAFLMDNEEAARYGYDCHICARTEVLDEDLTTVLYQKRHDWFMAWDGKHYVFTSFGPWDDVDPAVGRNARAILAHVQNGDPTVEWLPLMENMDWAALRAAAAGDEFAASQLCMAVSEAMNRCAAEQEEALLEDSYRYILSATEGLDGAVSESFSSTVWELYEQDPLRFAGVVLEDLTEAQREEIVMFLGAELACREGRDESLPAQEVLDRLEQILISKPPLRS